MPKNDSSPFPWVLAAAPGARRVVAIGVAFAIGIAGLHAVRSLRSLGEARRSAAEAGAVIAVTRGDVALRDVPKALDILQGRLLGDPHYVGEANWYPFATPLLAAAVARVSGLRINEAYFATGALLGAASLLAVALLCFSYGRALGLAAFPVLLLLGVIRAGNGVYPAETALLPLTLYLALAGAVQARPSREGSMAGLGLYAGLGALNGLLGLWHGASFVTATAVSLALWALLAVRVFRREVPVRDAAVRVVCQAGATAALMALLVVPQLLRYGALRQSDAARLYLEPGWSGNDPRALFTLSLVPAGEALWLLGFLTVFALAGRRRGPAIPLLAGYVAAKALAHAGFVIHSHDHPVLAAAARAVLVVPAHTLHGTSEAIFALMVAWSAITAVCMALESERLRSWASSHVGASGRIERLAVLTVAIPGAAALLFYPDPLLPARQLLDARRAEFAERLAAAMEPNTAIVGAMSLANLAPLKALWVGSDEHANPYAQPERREAYRALKESVLTGDLDTAAAILRRYRVRYELGGGPLAAAFGQEVLLRSPEGDPVYRLAVPAAPAAAAR